MGIRAALPKAAAGGLATVLGLGCTLLVTPPASAHASLVSSDPAAGAVLDAPPATATFTYSEAVAPDYTEVAVTPPGGEPVTVEGSAASVDGPTVTVDLASVTEGAAAGRWEILVRIVSADGHPVETPITFEAGAATGTTEPTSPAATPATTPTSSAPTSSAPVTLTPTDLDIQPVTGSGSDGGGLPRGVIIALAALAAAAIGGGVGFLLWRRTS